MTLLDLGRASSRSATLAAPSAMGTLLLASQAGDLAREGALEEEEEEETEN